MLFGGDDAVGILRIRDGGNSEGIIHCLDPSRKSSQRIARPVFFWSRVLTGHNSWNVGVHVGTEAHVLSVIILPLRQTVAVSDDNVSVKQPPGRQQMTV